RRAREPREIVGARRAAGESIAMAGEPSAPIVVKRAPRRRRHHHAGSWKIAYADFVTAMMAFFLLMWLIGSTTQGDLEGIAEFFRTPRKVARRGGSGSGDRSSVIQGGGTDLSRSVGQREMTDEPMRYRSINLHAAQAELVRRELETLEALKARMERAIDDDPRLARFRN